MGDRNSLPPIFYLITGVALSLLVSCANFQKTRMNNTTVSGEVKNIDKNDLSETMSFSFTNYANLSFPYHPSWAFMDPQQPVKDVVTMEFYSTTKEYRIMITAMKNQGKEPVTAESVFEAVEQGRDKAEPSAVEKEIKIWKFENGNGYYFRATDKGPITKGEYKYMQQGCFFIEEVFVIFTVLSNRQDDICFLQTVAAFENAKLTKK